MDPGNSLRAVKQSVFLEIFFFFKVGNILLYSTLSLWLQGSQRAPWLLTSCFWTSSTTSSWHQIIPNLYLKVIDTVNGTYSWIVTIYTMRHNCQHGLLLILLWYVPVWLYFTALMWWLWKFKAHQRKGSIKMQHIIATIIAILYPPIPSSLPVLAISKDQKSQRKSCASWFVDGSSEVTEEELLTGSPAQWSPKVEVIIEVLPPAKGGRWKALNFLEQ